MQTDRQLTQLAARTTKLEDCLDRAKSVMVDLFAPPRRTWTDPRTRKRYPVFASKEAKAEANKIAEVELERGRAELAYAKADQPARIHAAKMEVGQVAVFHWSTVTTRRVDRGDGRSVRVGESSDQPLFVRVVEVMSKDAKLVEVVDEPGRTVPRFIVKGEPTARLVTGKAFELNAAYRVEGTQKIGRDTVFVLTPAPKKGGAALEGKKADERKPDEGRWFWRFAPQHGGGYYKLLGNGTWEEVGKDGKRMAVWEEVGRTADHVELYDAKRNYKTRLAAGKSWMTSGRESTQFKPSPAGDWERSD